MAIDTTAPAGGQKVALVTGSANGIGKAIVQKLAADGYAVVINDLEANKEKAEAFAAELKKQGHKASVALADVSDFEQVKNMVNSLDRLDVMVANAAVVAPVDFITDDHIDGWQKTFDVNLKGHLLCYKFAAIKMIAQGWGGRIIGASSIVGRKPEPGRMTYSATKWAIRGLTQQAAFELGKHKITVNCYAPGLINSELAQQYMASSPVAAEMMNAVINTSAVGRIGEPEEVAALVSFLVSDGAGFITGQTVSIDGGIVFT
ncbi:NAD-binding protein [Coprinellus micaceus]|uniref:NAD-binding protein n=1 Tax=Coprinellus micaceus TaxID=71717 RepID=A0A4Y7SHG8_COPMI|nr:NAD-binding protein [Coprinellus micaceus]